MSSEAVVTVRLVRSFEHRNFKPVVFRGVDLNQTVEEFIAHVRKFVSSKDGLPPPFKKFAYEIFEGQTFSWHHITNFLHYENKDLTVVQLKILSPDTLKIIHQAHGAKTNELVMSLDDDDKLILRQGITLKSSGVGHETELAFFRSEDYERFKANPKTSW